jgi:C4-dicarboxylate-specific signal transduction histidine kinase
MDEAVDLDDVENQLAPSLDTKPTLAFIHGAFGDGASWSVAVEHLGDHGPYRILADPLRGVTGAARAARLQSMDGPIVLIGRCRRQMQQPIVNLISNAVEATSEPRARSAAIVRSAPLEREVEVSVEDRGPRADLEPADHLFDPFLTPQPLGMGMGLSTGRAIAEARGGRVSVGTAKTGGAVFRLTVPTVDRAL